MYATLTSAIINDVRHQVVAALHETPVEGAVLCGASVEVGDVYAGGGFLRRAGVELASAPKSAAVILAEAKQSLLSAVEQHAEMLRIAVAGTASGSKLATYQAKYETALAALGGDQAALAALEPEATARGETAVELAALVKQLGDQWRAAGLAIDAAYQGHKAAIAALPDLSAVRGYDLTSGWPTLS
jgi:hypothetical protein